MQEQEAAEFNVQRAINQARDKINAKRKGKHDIKSQAERLIKAINRERELLDNAAEETLNDVPAGNESPREKAVPVQHEKPKTKPNNNQRGYVSITPDGAAIGLTQKADASTFLHEFWHITLDDLLRFGTREGVSEQVRADRQTAMDWLEITEPILTTRIECALHKRNGRVRTKYQ